MTDPVTAMTAGVIVALAFQKFIETGIGELGKRFTGEAINKMDRLLSEIWSKLRGRPIIDEVKVSVEQTKKVTDDQLDKVIAYLQVAMDEDNHFADAIRTLAQEIDSGRLTERHTMTMILQDNARGWQTKVEGGTAYIGEINIHNDRKDQ